MPSFHPDRDDLPEVFPVFPLTGALLLPRGRLPLNIFEPRYLNMTTDALGAGRMFGMVQPDPGRPAGAGGPALFRVGCLGRLTSFSETDDGRFLISLTGVIRFHVVEEVEGRRGYRQVRAAYGRYEGDLSTDAAEIDVPRETLLSELRAFFARSGLEANWDAVARMEDDLLVVTLCMICPFAPAEKQALLEAETMPQRAQALLALLRMGGRDEGEDGRAAS